MTTTGPTPVVNNGLYHAQNMILSFGLQIACDELLKRQKTHDWRTDRQQTHRHDRTETGETKLLVLA